jgi:hypothetical protein
VCHDVCAPVAPTCTEVEESTTLKLYQYDVTSALRATVLRSTYASQRVCKEYKLLEPGPIADVSRVCSGRGSLGLSINVWSVYAIVVSLPSIVAYLPIRHYRIGILLYPVCVYRMSVWLYQELLKSKIVWRIGGSAASRHGHDSRSRHVLTRTAATAHIDRDPINRYRTPTNAPMVHGMCATNGGTHAPSYNPGYAVAISPSKLRRHSCTRSTRCSAAATLRFARTTFGFGALAAKLSGVADAQNLPITKRP